MSPSVPPPRKVVVVGAGPVGCLAAMAFAKQGWSVNLYEGRSGVQFGDTYLSDQLTFWPVI